MSSLLINPNDSPVQPAFDPYWDKPMPRREVMLLVKKLAMNDNELMGMADTAAILINFICEKKLGIVDRKEVDEYVAVKHEQLKAQRASMKAAAARGEDPDAGGNATDAQRPTESQSKTQALETEQPR